MLKLRCRVHQALIGQHEIAQHGRIHLQAGIFLGQHPQRHRCVARVRVVTGTVHHPGTEILDQLLGQHMIGLFGRLLDRAPVGFDRLSDVGNAQSLLFVERLLRAEIAQGEIIIDSIPTQRQTPQVADRLFRVRRKIVKAVGFAAHSQQALHFLRRQLGRGALALGRLIHETSSASASKHSPSPSSAVKA